MRKIHRLLSSCRRGYFKYLYLCTLNHKIRKIRRKETIRVLFAVAESATWKNDSLYRAMLMHPGFTPLILVLPDEQKEESLKREGVDTCFDFFRNKKVCQNAHLLFFTHKAPTFTSWGFVIT